MIQASGIDHIVLHCGDVRRSKAFYTEALGMTVYREDDGHVFMHAGARRRALHLFQRPRRAPPAADASSLSLGRH